MTGKLGLVIVAMSLVLAACGGHARAGSVGDPQAGKALFHLTSIREAPACSTCHAVEPGKTIVGPSLAGIAPVAGERKPGITAEVYLRESILDPNAYIVEGFAEGVMYQQFDEVLSEEEINNLVAYLLTIK